MVICNLPERLQAESDKCSVIHYVSPYGDRRKEGLALSFYLRQIYETREALTNICGYNGFRTGLQTASHIKSVAFCQFGSTARTSSPFSTICHSRRGIYTAAEHMITYRPFARVTKYDSSPHFSFPKGIYADGYSRL